MKARILFATILLTTLTMGSCNLRSHPVKALGHIDEVQHFHLPNWMASTKRRLICKCN